MPKINGLLTKEEREKRTRQRYEYIVKLRDELGLTFAVIAKRLDMAPRRVAIIYAERKK